MPSAPFGSSGLPSGRLGASILAPSGSILAPRGHPRGPWEHQDGHEGIRNRIFIDFWLLSGSYFERFLGTEAWNLNFFSGLFPGHFFVLNFDPKFIRLVLKPGVRMESIAKNKLSHKSFLSFGLDFYRFLEALGLLFLILLP